MVNIIDEKSFRNERKFFVENLTLHQVIHLVKMHPSLFQKAYPPRWINNIYFDTEDMESYGDNVSGVADRLKVRLRWYGNLFGKIDESTLELKIKRGLVGTKQHFDFGPFEFRPGFSNREFLKILKKSKLSSDEKRRMKNLHPSLCNRYLRRYYFSANKKFRLTVDTDMTYLNMKGHKNSFRHQCVDHGKIIVELKYESDNDFMANKLSTYFPFRVTKSSKYVQGIDKFILL